MISDIERREEDSFMRLAHDVVRALRSSACGYFGVSGGRCSMCPASARGNLCLEAMLDDADSRIRALGQRDERDGHDGWERLAADARQTASRLSCLRYLVLGLDPAGNCELEKIQNMIEEGEL